MSRKRYCALSIAEDQLGVHNSPCVYFEKLFNFSKNKPRTCWSQFICFEPNGSIVIDTHTEVHLGGAWWNNIYMADKFDEY